MTDVPAILSAKGNPDDVELTVEARDRRHPANRVTMTHDGVEALEYPRREGVFWALINERPADPAE